MSQLPPLEQDVRNRLAALGFDRTEEQKDFMERLADADAAGLVVETSVKDPLWDGYRAGEDKQKAIELFKQLDKTGCGTFTVGRHGKTSRIVWKFDVRQIARAFLGLDAPFDSMSGDLRAPQVSQGTGQGLTDFDSDRPREHSAAMVAERPAAEHDYARGHRVSPQAGISDAAASSGDRLSVELYDHSFLLRPGLKVTVSLPLNITKDEANRLAEFIRSVPF